MRELGPHEVEGVSGGATGTWIPGASYFYTASGGSVGGESSFYGEWAQLSANGDGFVITSIPFGGGWGGEHSMLFHSRLTRAAASAHRQSGA